MKFYFKQGLVMYLHWTFLFLTIFQYKINHIVFDSLLPFKKHIAILANMLTNARTVQSNPSKAKIETCIFSFMLDHKTVSCSSWNILSNKIYFFL